MNSEAFIAGFVKKAIDLGYEDEAVADLFKLAMADPKTAKMLKSATVRSMLTDPQQAVLLHQILNEK